MSSIRRNFIYNSIYQILLFLLPLITAPYISRVLGPSGIGTYAYTNTIANYFVLFSMLGVNNYGNRSIAMARERKSELSETFWGIYYFQLLISLIMSIVYIIILLSTPLENKLIYFLQFLFVISAAFDINWFCFGLEKFRITVVRNIIIRLLTVLAIFYFVKTEADLWIYTLLMAGSMLISQLVIWPFVIKNVYFIRPRWKSIKQHIKPNLLLFIPVIAVSLYKIMGKIMIGLLSTLDEVGFYHNAMSIISIPMGIITALGTVMLPRMSSLISKGYQNQSKQMIEKSMVFIMFLSSALMFGIAGIAPVFVPWFFGDKFIRTTELVIYMAPSIIFISWANVIRTQYLIPNSKDKHYIISVLIGALVNIIINIILIPSIGALGAAIGTVLAEVSVCVIQNLMVRKEIDLKSYFIKGVAFIIFGVAMFVTVRLLSSISSSAIVTLSFQIFVGALVYLILSFGYLLVLRKKKVI
ncbi:oligosaccharide flippase family protein [Caldifermentibacillus hisashii]|uniref:oligosaccharide flippase family protein n=1 Tax=Caldifermentibacillus hisashii TaxID=996558 RepID=UPI0022B9D25C|nr:oligosaccharide flippase family protein [Caldifermentibacillus hisashii]